MLSPALLLNPVVQQLLRELPLERLALLQPLLRHEKFETFTDEDFGLLGQVFGSQLEVTDELKTAARALLRGQEIDSVADLIKSPESLRQIVTFFKGGAATLRIANENERPLNAGKRRGLFDCEQCGSCNPVEYDEGQAPFTQLCIVCSHPKLISEE